MVQVVMRAMGGMVQAVMRAMGSDGERQMKLRSARQPLTSCCAAQLLTGAGGGVGVGWGRLPYAISSLRMCLLIYFLSLIKISVFLPV